MDEKRKEIPAEEDWFDDLLGKPVPEKDLGPDEHAVHSAGLIHPDDMELEQILAELRSEEAELEEFLMDPGFDIPLTEEFQEELPLDPLEADIAAAVESVMAEQESVSPEGASPLVVDPQVQEAVSDEVTRFFEVPEEVLPQEYVQEAAEDPLPAEEELPEEALPQEPKGRPKMKKGYGLLGIPHILSTFVWLVIILLAGVSLGRTLWLCCSDLMAFGKAECEAVITITDADTIDTVAQKLADEGLIRYPGLFKQFAELTGKSENISAGTFTLNSRLDYNAMINGMSAFAPAREEVDIMFPEGYTCAQIFALLEKNNVCTVAELEEYAANGELDDYWFLEGVQRGDKYCLEGFLFPDTYTFYTNDDPRRVLEKFLDCFDVRFTDIMRERLVTINESYAQWLRDEGFSEEYIAEHPITVREAVIIASLIEKESAGVDENYIISSVIYNRLTDSSQPPYLNIDAALIYGLGGKVDPETGEIIPLTQADLATDNPYNTYLYAGLTPGAICNPGQECLNAALQPDDTSYYYYALDPETGTHRFFKTYKEHQKFVDSLD